MRYIVTLLFCIVSNLHTQESIDLESIDSLLILGYTARAESLLMQIDESVTDSIRHEYLLSIISIQKSDYDAAITSLEKIIEIDSENPGYFYLLANVYALKVQDSYLFGSFSDRKKMLQNLEKVLKLDPDFTQARYLLFQYHLNAPALFGAF